MSSSCVDTGVYTQVQWLPDAIEDNKSFINLCRWGLARTESMFRTPNSSNVPISRNLTRGVISGNLYGHAMGLPRPIQRFRYQASNNKWSPRISAQTFTENPTWCLHCRVTCGLTADHECRLWTLTMTGVFTSANKTFDGKQGCSTSLCRNHLANLTRREWS